MVSKGQKKGSQPGKTVNSKGSSLLESVTNRVGSWLKPKPRVDYIIKLAKSRTFGKFFYTVESPLPPVTFTKKKDAEAFRKLLAASTGEYPSVTIKREITKDGYVLTNKERK